MKIPEAEDAGSDSGRNCPVLSNQPITAWQLKNTRREQYGLHWLVEDISQKKLPGCLNTGIKVELHNKFSDEVELESY